jgi:predicted nucleic-acid-binding protein
VIAETIEMLMAHQTLSVEQPETVASALKLFRENRKTDFADCLILENARRAANLPVGTFDRALAKLPGTERLG